MNTLIKLLKRLPLYLLIGLVALYALFPFYWALNTSFKSESEMFESATYLPENPTLKNYEYVFRDGTFLLALRNSAIVSSAVSILSLTVGSFAAYALGRLRFKGRTIILYIVLSMTMFPSISVLSGLYTIVREFGVFGTPLALIITYPIFTLPFTVWVLTSFFRGLPAEIEQAAIVDGATPFQTFRMILLPLTAPALVTTGLLSFVQSWNEYLFALNFTITEPSAQTVPVAIAQFSGKVARQEPIAEIMAAAMIVTIPLVILVLIFQNRIVAGLTAGAVKG
ncbi:carbohydrate ABC transporter permease [Phototrophicus methaneseepsis]|uniref:Carbohydrate ABC transporter permease n=1 Tax=Phototrophicus methaneseepsis TaxID=2710758 RepID=A0A7S8EBS3_9CHLR|nr:carbohydrate ABC transporter permease [Phototrophicus methaneseepsis]QPC84036.1 carbohydrate ABC transporter permease [Phototrophicus methaneseepsis]